MTIRVYTDLESLHRASGVKRRQANKTSGMVDLLRALSLQESLLYDYIQQFSVLFIATTHQIVSQEYRL